MKYLLVPPEDRTPFWDGCPACRGLGRRGRGKCSICAGTGKIKCTPWAKMIFIPTDEPRRSGVAA